MFNITVPRIRGFSADTVGHPFVCFLRAARKSKFPVCANRSSVDTSMLQTLVNVCLSQLANIKQQTYTDAISADAAVAFSRVVADKLCSYNI